MFIDKYLFFEYKRTVHILCTSCCWVVLFFFIFKERMLEDRKVIVGETFHAEEMLESSVKVA